ncbi:uncharacterized protein LOC131425743 [Malaya genurostris]|uniref:uncharacterized protein LOC131425743 n=1 Tax=Malaya genurostris TaxID=325434 RepID=UPI0026F3E90B|nr:uncharacterized protein LOC131425743 [Malaya genurostris]
MEIETITLERWMCRICLDKGSYNIFEEQLPITAPMLHSTINNQGHSEGFHSTMANDTITIVDALNSFSEFKVSPSEIDNEPMMLCENCRNELLRCLKFRAKIHETESLLRRDCVIQVCKTEQEEAKTSLTLQLADVDPFLEDEDECKVASGQEKLVLKPESDHAKPGKVHHAKPRFQLTNQVSNILRNVATSSISFGGKRKESEEPVGSSTPLKMQRKDSHIERKLEKTLVVPNYIFKSETDDTQKKNVLHIEKTTVSSSSQIISEKDFDRSESNGIFYCTDCPKAFSAAYHLLVHTRSTHLCQYCLKHFDNVSDRNKHIREEHKTFKCSICNFQTHYATNLRAHLKKNHEVSLPAHVSILQVQQDCNENK